MCTGDNSELVTLIDRGEIDLALVEGSFDHHAFEGEPLSSEPFVAVAASGKKSASVRELLDQRLILREPGSGMRDGRGGRKPPLSRGG